MVDGKCQALNSSLSTLIRGITIVPTYKVQITFGSLSRLWFERSSK